MINLGKKRNDLLAKVNLHCRNLRKINFQADDENEDGDIKDSKTLLYEINTV